jgi:hypothetical protein
MQGSYKPALKRKILTNGLNKKLRREPRLRSRVRMHCNNLIRMHCNNPFCSLNLSYDLNPPKPCNPLKPLLEPEHPNQRNMNSSLGQIKEIEVMRLPKTKTICLPKTEAICLPKTESLRQKKTTNSFNNSNPKCL